MVTSSQDGGETRMKVLLARLIATAITYGIITACGIIGIWGGLG